MSGEKSKKTFGARVRRRREAAKLSAKELGKSVGLSKKTILNMENGNNWPSVPRYAKICRKLRAGKLPMVDQP